MKKNNKKTLVGLLMAALVLFAGYKIYDNSSSKTPIANGGGTGGGSGETQNPGGATSTPSQDVNTIKYVEKTIKIDEINWEFSESFTYYSTTTYYYYSIVDDNAFLLSSLDNEINSFDEGTIYVINKNNNFIGGVISKFAVRPANKGFFSKDYFDSIDSLIPYFDSLKVNASYLFGDNLIGHEITSLDGTCILFIDENTTNSVALLSKSFNFENMEWIDTSLTTDSGGYTGKYYYYMTEDENYLFVLLSFDDFINTGTILNQNRPGVSTLYILSKENIVLLGHINNSIILDSRDSLTSSSDLSSVETIGDFLNQYVCEITLNLTSNDFAGTKIETIDIIYKG